MTVQLWFPVCLTCKEVSSVAGYSDQTEIRCPPCDSICEDANTMVKNGTLEFKSFTEEQIDEILLKMNRGASLGEVLY